MLELIDKPYDVVSEKIDYMMGHEPGIKEIFYLKRNRLFSSQLAALIRVDDIDVGFLNIVDEGLRNMLFIDQGIIERYRGRGYGKEAIISLINSGMFDEYLIDENKKNNILANNSASKIAPLVHQNSDRNYYLFNNDLNQFLNSNEYKVLVKRFK